ncbi:MULTISPECIES: type II CRISPR-associated endonuclease Cas1 [unclassified Campylobacter]|uniref:type II CRISPR-associated endonuclease Cas1 n=1 Tax=unclassified Campylobacter TaxID=2593542 RepID=UPI0022E9C7D1|nr:MULTISPECIES: type II CRISPR-associated endonuclease Cas1 [unclassified Campylobacter]MDA3078828.1 type II CRISPR-associated endonuclease Cas1 [Campylobacter sp. CS_NA2]MDA3080881.1 type II CRISPR-associated endonuclease Cas1 [Campylobacter sp. CS_NA1]MDA3084914.1 type II CRISPR-associated endonuclease Cas1 [Campylobacter sp. CS_ED1]MDA3089692.1 type II CRISPR-associated endonuclease Cas1 [Campylobacter sp. CS_ED2]WBR51744.1 type II CRISPR-associated endonuclease Cas1 [Campylobacter sp. CS_
MAGFDESFRSLMIGSSAKLSLKNANLLIERPEKGSVSVALSDIHTIILESPAITLTSALLCALAEHKIVLLCCDASHSPNGVFMPYLTHYQSNAVIKSQIAQTKQHKAILWQYIIKTKIQNQANLARKFDKKVSEELVNLSKKVVLGDTKNCEGIAAAKYFKAIFGSEFSRDEPIWINSALNYVYAIIRSCVVRNIVASGLLPIFGVGHDNIFNNFNLADDLMEPYRPFGDELVLELFDESKDTFLSVKDKANLAEILEVSTKINGKKFSLAMAIAKTVQSYKNSLASGVCELEFAGL